MEGWFQVIPVTITTLLFSLITAHQAQHQWQPGYYSAISPIAVQASYRAACTDRAWSAIRSALWMSKPRQWPPVLISLGKQWINGISVEARLVQNEYVFLGKRDKKQMQCILWTMARALNHKLLLLGHFYCKRTKFAFLFTWQKNMHNMFFRDGPN